MEHILDQLKEFSKIFTVFDYGVILVVLLFGLRCLIRGFAREILSLLGIAGAIILSRTYHQEAAAFFEPYTQTELQATILAYAAICGGTIISASIIAWIIYKIIRKNVLGVVDRLAGFFIGAAQGAILAGIVLIVIEAMTGTPELPIARGSVIAPLLRELIHLLSGIAMEYGKPSGAHVSPIA